MMVGLTGPLWTPARMEATLRGPGGDTAGASCLMVCYADLLPALATPGSWGGGRRPGRGQLHPLLCGSISHFHLQNPCCYCRLLYFPFQTPESNLMAMVWALPSPGFYHPISFSQDLGQVHTPGNHHGFTHSSIHSFIPFVHKIRYPCAGYHPGAEVCPLGVHSPVCSSLSSLHFWDVLHQQRAHHFSSPGTLYDSRDRHGLRGLPTRTRPT